MRGRNGRALWLGLLMLAVGVLIPGICAHAEGGNEAQPIVSIEDGIVVIHAKHYLNDENDGEAIPVENQQFSARVFIEVPGIPIPVHIFNKDALNADGEPMSYFFNEEGGNTRIPLLLGEEMVELREIAEQIKWKNPISLAVFESTGYGKYLWSKKYIQYDKQWFKVEIYLSDDYESIESYKLYYINTDDDTYDPVPEGTELAFYNKIKTASLTVPATMTLKTAFGEGRTPEAGAFEFIILDEKGKEVSRGKNKADGTIDFAPMKFVDEDKHTYTIKQVVDSGNPSIEYDTKVYTMVAKAKEPWTNDYKPLEMDKVEYSLGNDEVEKIVFHNILKEAKVHFDPNGGSGMMQDANVALGSDYTLPACGFTPPSGKTFKAWKVGNAEKQPNDVITVNGDITVKALWKKTSGSSATPDREICTITFDFDEGVWTDSATGDKKDSLVWYVNKGDTITLPSAPVREGYTFSYWKGSKYNPGDSYTVVGDHTFTAMWEKNPEKAEPETPQETPKSEDHRDILKRLKGAYERDFVMNGGKPTVLPKAGVGGK